MSLADVVDEVPEDPRDSKVFRRVHGFHAGAPELLRVDLPATGVCSTNAPGLRFGDGVLGVFGCAIGGDSLGIGGKKRLNLPHLLLQIVS